MNFANVLENFAKFAISYHGRRKRKETLHVKDVETRNNSLANVRVQVSNVHKSGTEYNMLVPLNYSLKS